MTRNKIFSFCWLFLGVLLQPSVLSRILKGGTGFSPAVNLIVAGLAGICLLAGIYPWLNARWQRRMRLSVMAVVFVLACFEILGQIVIRTVVREDRYDKYQRYATEAMAGSPWAREFFREFNGVRREFKPYVGFQMQPVTGQYVTILPEGIRRTWEAPGLTAQSTNVYFFGGSTALGDGSRDEFTIASMLAREAHAAGIPARVVNYGNSGTTFATELVRLVVLLRDGHRPDLVVFYDGVNDGAAAVSGSPREIDSYQSIFHPEMSSFRWRMLKSGLLGLINENLMLLKLADGLKKALRGRAASPVDQQQAETFGLRAAEYYAVNADLLDRLSRAYGFQYILFWQPNTYLEQNILPGEEQALKRWPLDDFSRAVHLALRRQLQLRGRKNFYDISDALAGRTASIYHDWCHPNEAGDALIARRIFKYVQPLLAGERP